MQWHNDAMLQWRNGTLPIYPQHGVNRNHNQSYIAIMEINKLIAHSRRDITCSPVLTASDRKMWIATAAMLAASVASSIIGGAKAQEKANKAAKERTARENKEQAWYEKQYNTDYLDTKAGQNLMRRAQEIQDNYVRKADGAAAVGGGTTASVAQAKEAANRAMGDTIANVAAQDTKRKQQVADQHQQNQSQFSREREAAITQEANNTSQASANMSNTLMQAGVNQLGSQSASTNKQSSSMLGSNNSGIDTTKITQAGQNAPSVMPTGGVNGLGLDPLKVATGTK